MAREVRVDLSADVGEAEDAAGQAVESELLGIVTTAHIACGVHAGSPETMRRTIDVALSTGVTIGAHPSYDDRPGFGRRPLPLDAATVADQVVRQLETLTAMAQERGARVRSVKAHGALYSRVATDEECASAVGVAVKAFNDDLAVVLPSGAATASIFAGLGMGTVAEAFCDRAYLADGGLVPRTEAGALITDPVIASTRAISAVVEHSVETVDGGQLAIFADTLCIHGDTPGAPDLARAVRVQLEHAGIRLLPAVLT